LCPIPVQILLNLRCGMLHLLDEVEVLN